MNIFDEPKMDCHNHIFDWIATIISLTWTVFPTAPMPFSIPQGRKSVRQLPHEFLELRNG